MSRSLLMSCLLLAAQGCAVSSSGTDPGEGPGNVRGDDRLFAGDAALVERFPRLEGSVLVSAPEGDAGGAATAAELETLLGSSHVRIFDRGEPSDPADVREYVASRTDQGTFAYEDLSSVRVLFGDDAYAQTRQGMRVLVASAPWRLARPGFADRVRFSNFAWVAGAGDVNAGDDDPFTLPGPTLHRASHPFWDSLDARYEGDYGTLRDALAGPDGPRPSRPDDPVTTRPAPDDAPMDEGDEEETAEAVDDPILLVREGAGRFSHFSELTQALSHGHGLLVVWALPRATYDALDVDVAGDAAFLSDAASVHCGAHARWCLAVPALADDVVQEGARLVSGASTAVAAGRVAWAAFYLHHLWPEAPGRVVETLAACAVDAGETGVDPVFGRGVLSLDCDRVRRAERLSARGALRLDARSPGVERALAAPGRLEVAAPGDGLVLAYGWVTARDAGAGLDLQLGSRATLGLVSGAGRAALGVSSAVETTRTASFAEASARFDLLGGADTAHRVSLLGLVGAADDAHRSWAARAGVSWRAVPDPGWSVSAWAAAVRAGARVGLPGARRVGRGRVAVRDADVELRLRARWSF